MAEAETYIVQCHKCRAELDALQAEWCSCLVTDRSFVCPSCGSCFCKGPISYKQKFWAGAPRALWDRKTGERRDTFEPPPNPAPEDVRRPLVLLVEDERDIQRVALKVIEGLGYGMALARNGAEGLELSKRYMPDLVLTDALMPKLDGREMARQIKDDPATAHIKVVVMTALYTNIKYQNEAFLAYKVDDYLSKPLDVEQLRGVLERHLKPAAAPAEA